MRGETTKSKQLSKQLKHTGDFMSGFSVTPSGGGGGSFAGYAYLDQLWVQVSSGAAAIYPSAGINGNLTPRSYMLEFLGIAGGSIQMPFILPKIPAGFSGTMALGNYVEATSPNGDIYTYMPKIGVNNGNVSLLYLTKVTQLGSGATPTTGNHTMQKLYAA